MLCPRRNGMEASHHFDMAIDVRLLKIDG